MRLLKPWTLVVLIAALASVGIGQTTADPAAPAVPPAAESEIPAYLPGGEEAGPTLSTQRGIGAIRSGESLTKISPYLGVTGVYDTGLGQFATDEQGNLINQDAYGVELSFGLIGSRAFRRSLLNVAYRGSYRHYPNFSLLSNSDHRGEVELKHAFSRRLSLASSNSFGYFNNAFFSNLGFNGFNDSQSGVPINDFFNTPTVFANTTQLLTYQKSARLSFTGGGGGSLQWRNSDALAGVKTVSAIGNAAYRVSQRQTIAVNYQFNQLFFTNQYGGSNVHTVSAEYGAQVNRTTTITLLFGGSRVESQSEQIVALDPLLAALLGRGSSIEADYRKNYLPTFGASLDFRRRAWSFGVRGRREVNPGNGLVLTNLSTSYGANLRYAGGRRWNVGGGVSYNSMNGLKGEAADFEGYNANLGYNLTIARGFSWVVDAGWRRIGAGSSALATNLQERDQFRLSTGIFWSPSPVPLPFF